MDENNLGRALQERRKTKGLTLQQVSISSGHILHKIAQPLGFQEEALLIDAGYLSTPSASERNSHSQDILGGLDPYVARVLSQEPVKLQRTVVAILTILKSIAQK